MPRLPARFAAVILCFAPLFFQRSWRHAEVLLVGAILAPGRRTVASILRISGLCRERRFVNYHRVLNRAAWSGRAQLAILSTRSHGLAPPPSFYHCDSFYTCSPKCSNGVFGALLSVVYGIRLPRGDLASATDRSSLPNSFGRA